MNASRFLTGSWGLISLIALAACGGGGPPQPEHAAVRTLAYVVTECHEDVSSASASQRLQVVRGDAAPVTVMEIPTYGRLPALGLCPGFGANGDGNASVFALAFQALGVSPDGSGVVFAVTLRDSPFPVLGLPSPLTPEQEGIFVVGADGMGLRRLGPPSREPAQRVFGSITAPTGTYFNSLFRFSPNGRAITFMDRGPGPGGEDAPQVVILDLATGERTPVTHLPDLPPDALPDPNDPSRPATESPNFKDDTTIIFFSRVNPNGLNPNGEKLAFTVKTDGTELTELRPFAVVLPGSVIVPRLFITGRLAFPDVATLSLPGRTVNPSPFYPPDFYWNRINEIFVLSPDHVLQLTNFRRGDSGGANTDGKRVFLTASANPVGTNPSENCQIFSLSALGGDLRQLTHFGAADHSAIGCVLGILQQPGCSIDQNEIILDPETQTLVFSSTCDPLGTNASGKQYFAIRSNGTGLRQVVATRGLVTAADGSVDVELAGPFVYQAIF